MVERSGKIRARRNGQPVPSKVAVTGTSTPVGRLVAEQLAAADNAPTVVAVDGDITDPAIVSRLSGCDVVIHAAVDVTVTESSDGATDRSYRNIRGTQTVVTAAAAAGVRRVIVVTSAMVYGALPDNPIPLDEDADLRAESDGGLVADLLEVEAICERAPRSHTGMSVTVVRPAALVGEAVDTVLTRHFEAPRLLVVRGSSPAWQLCHIEDLASALVFAAINDLDGPLTVGADGHLNEEDVEKITGRSRIELPQSFVFGTAQRLHRLGVTPAPSSELHYVTHPWVVSGARLKAAGWTPRYDNAEALTTLMDEIGGRHALASRRIGRRETATAATIGAAGATVAILGTAVAVRKARRRRKG